MQKRENDDFLEINCEIDAPMDIEELQNHPRRNIFRQVRNEGIKSNDVIVRNESPKNISDLYRFIFDSYIAAVWCTLFPCQLV